MGRWGGREERGEEAGEGIDGWGGEKWCEGREEVGRGVEGGRDGLGEGGIGGIGERDDVEGENGLCGVGTGRSGFEESRRGVGECGREGRVEGDGRNKGGDGRMVIGRTKHAVCR